MMNKHVKRFLDFNFFCFLDKREGCGPCIAVFNIFIHIIFGLGAICVLFGLSFGYTLPLNQLIQNSVNYDCSIIDKTVYGTRCCSYSACWCSDSNVCSMNYPFCSTVSNDTINCCQGSSCCLKTQWYRAGKSQRQYCVLYGLEICTKNCHDCYGISLNVTTDNGSFLFTYYCELNDISCINSYMLGDYKPCWVNYQDPKNPVMTWGIKPLDPVWSYVVFAICIFLILYYTTLYALTFTYNYWI